MGDPGHAPAPAIIWEHLFIPFELESETPCNPNSPLRYDVLVTQCDKVHFTIRTICNIYRYARRLILYAVVYRTILGYYYYWQYR